jgi:hypothetical protein
MQRHFLLRKVRIHSNFLIELMISFMNVVFFRRVPEFEKLTISAVMSVRPSVCPHGTTRLPLEGFSWRRHLIIFRKHVNKILVPLKSNSNNGYFKWRLIHIFLLCLAESLEREIFQVGTVEKIKTDISCSISFFRKSFRLWDNIDKYCREGQAIDNNMAHAHLMLGN